MVNVTNDISIKTTAEVIAPSMLPVDKFKNRFIGRVSVFMAIPPANISTAPNSAIPLAHVITVLPIMPDLAIGKVTFRKDSNSVLPRVCATSSYLGSMSENAEASILVVYGALTKNWANTIPAGEKTNFKPRSSSAIPSEVVPNMISNPKPATIGGKEIGRSRIILASLPPKKSYLAIAYAVGVDMSIQNMVDITDVIKLKTNAKRISSLLMFDINPSGVSLNIKPNITAKIRKVNKKVMIMVVFLK